MTRLSGLGNHLLFVLLGKCLPLCSWSLTPYETAYHANNDSPELFSFSVLISRTYGADG
nr:hypothetical protein [uncultured Prevotella sp.]